MRQSTTVYYMITPILANTKQTLSTKEMIKLTLGLFTLGVLSLSPSCSSWECKDYGSYCIDDKMCCGGCCLRNICVLTTRSCQIRTDICMEHYCPPGFECHTYRPHDCPECYESVLCLPSTN